MPKYPEIGDQVWFYFLHAFTDVKLQDGLWRRATGKFEMRCRPALVTAVYKPPVAHEFRMHTDLRVEFACDDLVPVFTGIRSFGGVAATMYPTQKLTAPHVDTVSSDPELVARVVDGRWPGGYTWAWDPMPGFEGGR